MRFPRFLLILALTVLPGVALQAALPKVFIIGDSISIGYTQEVKSALFGEAMVYRIAGNGQDTANGIENIDTWLLGGPYDVIHFNFGIWDANAAIYNPTVYASRLDTLIGKMKATGARLIFATSTPLADSEANERLKTLNQTAIEVMAAQGVTVDDLNTYMTPHFDRYQSDGTHYSYAGYQFLAAHVAGHVRAVINDQTLPQILPVTLPRLSVLDEPVTVQLLAIHTVGRSPLAWSLASGETPAGWSLNNSGLLSGQFADWGTIQFNVQVKDNANSLGSWDFFMTASRAPASTLPAMAPLYLGVPHRQQLFPTGGDAPFVWERTAGPLPKGLTLTSEGWLSGTPQTTGNFLCTLQITDTDGDVVEANHTFVVTAPPHPWTNAQSRPDLGAFWNDTWLGSLWVNPAYFPWYEHLQHGYLAWVTGDQEGCWLYTGEGDFWYTAESLYPWLYSNLHPGWLYYFPGTSQPRYFYSARTGGFVESTLAP